MGYEQGVQYNSICSATSKAVLMDNEGAKIGLVEPPDMNSCKSGEKKTSATKNKPKRTAVKTSKFTPGNLKLPVGLFQHQLLSLLLSLQYKKDHTYLDNNLYEPLQHETNQT